MSFGWVQAVLSLPLTTQQNLDLHQISNNIYSNTNYDKIFEKTFPEFLKRVFITNKKISQKEIDNKVKEHLRNEYLPRLINNYNILYKKMISAKKEFSEEGKPEAMLPRFYKGNDENMPQLSREEISELSLTAGRNGKSIIVKYYARRGFDEYWRDPSIEYVFQYENKKLILVNIKVLKNYGIKQFIKGV